MTQPQHPDIVPNITRMLHQRGKEYLSLRQIITSLPKRLRHDLGFTPRLSTAELAKNLTPLLGNTLQVYHGTTSVYIGHPHTPAELILHQVQQHPGVSPKQLGKRVPLSKHDYIAALNALLEMGAVVCTFKDTSMPTLAPARQVPSPATVQVDGQQEREAFLTAYRDVGQGRSFVRIHRLRDALPWSRQRFDQTLQTLVADYTIELHGGDPSIMTQEELRQSFTTADGTLYIALSWRGKT